MKLEYRYNTGTKLVEIIITGDYRPKITGESLKKIFDQIKDLDYGKILFDFRQANVLLNTITTYHRPQTFLKVGFARHIKYAYLFNAITDDIHFLETVMRNNGFEFHVFDNYDAAMKWLTDTNGINGRRKAQGFVK